MEKNKKAIAAELDDAIMKVFRKYQRKNGLKAGEMDPCDDYMKDMLVENIANIIAKSINDDLKLKEKEARR